MARYRRRKNPLTDAGRKRLMLIAAGIGALAIYFISKANAANAQVGDTGLTGNAGLPQLPSGLYTGAPGPSGTTPVYQSTLPAPTSTQVAQQGSIWANLKALPSSPYSSGYVNFPSGSQAAAALLPWRTDGVNYFTNWAGVVYSVPVETDAYGNYTAVTA